MDFNVDVTERLSVELILMIIAFVNLRKNHISYNKKIGVAIFVGPNGLWVGPLGSLLTCKKAFSSPGFELVVFKLSYRWKSIS